MKIGFVTCHYPPDSIGGGQMQSMRLCKALAQNNEVTVFTRTYSKHDVGREQNGGYILLRRSVSRMPGIKSIFDLCKVLKQIRQHRGEIQFYLSFHIQLAALMVIIAKILYGTKAAVSPRGFEDFDFKWHKKAFQKFIYKNADLIIIQSAAIEQNFLQKIREDFSNKNTIEKIVRKIRIFPNGIEVPSKQPSPVSVRDRQVVFVGRLESIKGIEYLINAWKGLETDYRLLIVGGGTLESRLKHEARGLNIFFKGECSEVEVKELLLQSRLLVLPSLSENFPNVILEALACGVPVVASSVGAIPELIEDGVNGYLVPPADAEMLSSKIKLALQSESEMNQMAEMAFQKVKQFDWKNLVGKFEIIMKTL